MYCCERESCCYIIYVRVYVCVGKKGRKKSLLIGSISCSQYSFFLLFWSVYVSVFSLDKFTIHKYTYIYMYVYIAPRCIYFSQYSFFSCVHEILFSLQNRFTILNKVFINWMFRFLNSFFLIIYDPDPILSLDIFTIRYKISITLIYFLYRVLLHLLSMFLLHFQNLLYDPFGRPLVDVTKMRGISAVLLISMGRQISFLTIGQKPQMLESFLFAKINFAQRISIKYVE